VCLSSWTGTAYDTFLKLTWTNLVGSCGPTTTLIRWYNRCFFTKGDSFAAAAASEAGCAAVGVASCGSCPPAAVGLTGSIASSSGTIVAASGVVAVWACASSKGCGASTSSSASPGTSNRGLFSWSMTDARWSGRPKRDETTGPYSTKLRRESRLSRRGLRGKGGGNSVGGSTVLDSSYGAASLPPASISSSCFPSCFPFVMMAGRFSSPPPTRAPPFVGVPAADAAAADAPGGGTEEPPGAAAGPSSTASSDGMIRDPGNLLLSCRPENTPLDDSEAKQAKSSSSHKKVHQLKGSAVRCRAGSGCHLRSWGRRSSPRSLFATYYRVVEPNGEHATSKGSTTSKDEVFQQQNNGGGNDDDTFPLDMPRLSSRPKASSFVASSSLLPPPRATVNVLGSFPR
jgi:hypothetical protein